MIFRGGPPLEKGWGEGEEKTKKKLMQGKLPRKKNSCKEEGKEKKFMQKERPGPVAMA